MQGGLGFTGFTIVFTTRSCTTSCKDLWMVSPGCLQDLSTEPVQGHAVSEDFTSIYKDLLIRTCKYKIIQERLRRFPQDQDLSKVFSQGPVQDHARISSRISVGSLRDFLSRIHTRSRRKPPPESQLRSLQDHVTKWAPRVPRRAIWLDLAWRKWWDGCVSRHKIRTAHSWERSDTQKARRWLQERCQNSY